jgi:hypothetical protein
MDFKTFLRWWKRELSLLMPEKLRQLVNSQQGFIVVKPIAKPVFILAISITAKAKRCANYRALSCCPSIFKNF